MSLIISGCDKSSLCCLFSLGCAKNFMLTCFQKTKKKQMTNSNEMSSGFFLENLCHTESIIYKDGTHKSSL